MRQRDDIELCLEVMFMTYFQCFFERKFVDVIELCEIHERFETLHPAGFGMFSWKVRRNSNEWLEKFHLKVV